MKVLSKMTENANKEGQFILNLLYSLIFSEVSFLLNDYLISFENGNEYITEPEAL